MRFLPHFVVLIMILWTTGCVSTDFGSSDSGRVKLERFALGDIGGWLELSVEANHKVGRWLLDTGSNYNLVSADFAQSHGLALRSPVTANTALGSVQGAEVLLPTLRVGLLERSRQKALVVDLGLIVGADGRGFDGVLGMPFFDGLELDLDLRGWTFETRKSLQDHCPEGMGTVPLDLYQGLPVIEVVVNDGLPESLLLDTGNPAGLVRVVSDAPSDSSPGIVLPGPARLNLARRVSIGEQVRLNVPVVELYSPSLKRALGTHAAGIIGTALLDGARLQLDLARRRACIEHGSFAVRGGFGMTLEQRDIGFYVGKVLPGSPAHAAGLEQGDVIQQWGGQPPEGDLPELWSRVQGLDEIELVVGDEARAVQLRRAYFVPLLP